MPESPVPATGSGAVGIIMPRLEPEDGLYYVRATSLLHHQAVDFSPEFAVSGSCVEATRVVWDDAYIHFFGW